MMTSHTSRKKEESPKPQTTTEATQKTPTFFQAPNIELPKAGGALKSLGETFKVNAANGTAGLSIPLHITPGRNGFGPSLNLSYNSGTGNGPFGVGWTVSLPCIHRRTERGIPKYNDEADSDTFVFSEAEELVPVYTSIAEGVVERYERTEGSYVVHQFRPRVESSYARIERWWDRTSRDMFWVVTTAQNIKHIFGKTEDARLVSGENIAQWFLQESADGYGNIIQYRYKKEDGARVDTALPHESNRSATEETQRYIQEIVYGNRTPHTADAWCFRVVFDYGEYEGEIPSYSTEQVWSHRADAFSSHRFGFEVRTRRLCQRVLMYHSFDELGVSPVLVNYTTCSYSFLQKASYLTSISYTGCEHETYTTSTTPSTEFTYTTLPTSYPVTAFAVESLEHLPSGVDGNTWTWVDLWGEGIAGVLARQEHAWTYKRNLGSGVLGPQQVVSTYPHTPQRATLLDLDGDGVKELVSYERPNPGYMQLSDEGSWSEAFVPFQSLPNRPLSGESIRHLDIDGDGFADILVMEDSVFTWYPSLQKSGYAEGQIVRYPCDESDTPRAIFSSKTELIVIADMNGDGLADIVRVRNGEVCYWSNQGYGVFGSKVTMTSAPLFAQHDSFDTARIRFGDIGGTGGSDMLYISEGHASIFLNQSGNAFAEKIDVTIPAVNSFSSLELVDLFGTGTSCLVWSSTAPTDAREPLRYINLAALGKPGLLNAYDTHMGKRVTCTYASSVDYYLQDTAAGTPWRTQLPFPVQVIAQVVTEDVVSSVTLTQRYAYHHGYYDGAEREFRGFGMVETWDTEMYAHTSPQSAVSTTLSPIHTKSWYHTGAPLRTSPRSLPLQDEFTAVEDEWQLVVSSVPDGLSHDEEREAYRSMRGMPLRIEVYVDDETDDAKVPFTIEQHRLEVEMLQSRADNAHGVFRAIDVEQLHTTSERDTADARQKHTFILSVDAFGFPIETATVVYPRTAPEHDAQAVVLATYAKKEVIHAVSYTDWYRIGVPYTSSAYELTGLSTHSTLLTREGIRSFIAGCATISYEQTPDGTPQMRLISAQKICYRGNDAITVLPYGELESCALVHQQYTTIYTSALLERVYGSRLATADLEASGYVYEDDMWWANAGIQTYAPENFFVVTAYTDSRGNKTEVTHDAYGLYPSTITDPLGNVRSSIYDYRVCAPAYITDCNGSRVSCRFDALGVVVAVVHSGKESATEGDTFEQPTQWITYDMHSLDTEGIPTYSHVFERTVHGDATAPIIQSRSYFDGWGRIIQNKHMVEPGRVPMRDASGVVSVDSTGSIIWDTSETRWLGTGRVIYNNKGNVVKTYEPFFCVDASFEVENSLVQWGAGSYVTYDGLSRPIRIDHPHGTFSYTVFSTWGTKSFDTGDTVKESTWYETRALATSVDTETERERHAAEVSSAYTETPTEVVYDTLGRPCISYLHCGFLSDGTAKRFATEMTYDITSNVVETIDTLGRTIQTATYDMLGRGMQHMTLDAGSRTVFMNDHNDTVKVWDDRGNTKAVHFDALGRPTHAYVTNIDGVTSLKSRTFYGESLSAPEANNHRGKMFLSVDSSGASTYDTYDFKGNSTLSTLRFLKKEMLGTIDWSSIISATEPISALEQIEAVLEPEVYQKTIQYDALNRPTMSVDPDKTIQYIQYNERSLQQSCSIDIQGVQTQVVISNVTYDEAGRRESISYGNGVVTRYTYDPLSRQLQRICTTQSSGVVIQDLTYVYDVVGNPVSVVDAAQQDVYFKNAEVAAEHTYTFDPQYRLIAATGREHVAQISAPTYQDPVANTLPHQNNTTALRSYTESFVYDDVGNVLRIDHVCDDGGWVRGYAYDTASNKLIKTSAAGDNHDDSATFSEQYTHDVHGNMTSTPALKTMEWNECEQLVRISDGTTETRYEYNAKGVRTRKVTTAGSVVKETRYLGSYEYYRTYRAGVIEHERNTIVVTDTAGALLTTEYVTYDEGAPLSPEYAVRFQHSNHQNSSTIETDNKGHVLSYEEYYASGATSYVAATSIAETSLKRYRFAGKERDQESGFDYYGARYYAPWLMRWTACDPAGLIDGPNLYAFVKNNPITFVDAGGMGSTKNPLDMAYEKEVVEEFDKLMSSFEAQKMGYKLAKEVNISVQMPDGSWVNGRVDRIVQDQYGTLYFKEFKFDWDSAKTAAQKKYLPAAGHGAQIQILDDLPQFADPISGGTLQKGYTTTALQKYDIVTRFDLNDQAKKMGIDGKTSQATIRRKRDGSAFRTDFNVDAGGTLVPNGPSRQIAESASKRALTSAGRHLFGAVLIVGFGMGVSNTAQAAEQGNYGRAAAEAGATFFDPIDIGLTVYDFGTATWYSLQENTIPRQDMSYEAKCVLECHQGIGTTMGTPYPQSTVTFPYWAPLSIDGSAGTLSPTQLEEINQWVLSP